MRVSFPLRSIKSKNSTAKTTMAVVNEARKVEIGTPSFFWPVPPACSRAVPKSGAAILANHGRSTVMRNERKSGIKLLEARLYAVNLVRREKNDNYKVLSRWKVEQHMSRGSQTSQTTHEFKGDNRHIKNRIPGPFTA